MRLGATLALGCTALVLLGCGQSEPGPPVAEAPAKGNRIQEERPPHPEHFDVIPKAREPSPPTQPPPKLKPGEIPPASAGTNGSYHPSELAGGADINPRSMAEQLEPQAADSSAIVLNGIALAPPNAPRAIKAAISAANMISGRPYLWGGGHSSWYAPGYDCSGAVSYALGGGGFLATPLSSSQLASWGAPGRGRWLTVFANASHAYAVIAGLRWDTVGDARGSGPRWHPAVAYPEGFVARHVPGY